jgi:hypothetical protein
MGYYSFSSGGSSGFNVPSNVDYIEYYVVGGGGGGSSPIFFGQTAQPGGASYINTTGLYAGGGSPGDYYSGGGGGYGNYSYGQSGEQSYADLVPRAAPGYGSSGYGGPGASIASSGSDPQTYGGGGGGASRGVYYRNQNGAIPGQYVSWTIGDGGRQGGTGSRRYGQSGALYAYVYTYDPPSVSISSNRSSLIRGESATLSWSSNANSTSISPGIGGVGSSGSTTVSPSSSTTYTISGSNPAYTSTANVSITVYIPPQVILSLSRSSIVLGESVTLSWSTSGDANTASVYPGIGNTSVNGSTTVSPIATTTYTASVSGSGGSDTDQITLTVLQPPAATITAPPSVNYGEDIIVSYTAINAVTSVQIVPYWSGNNVTEIGTPITVATGNAISGTVTFDVPYNNFGPRYAGFTINVVGYGGLTSSAISSGTTINIDETPNNIIIPDSDGVFKDEDIVTPDEIVTSYKVQINDIDIPVEIKSDHPIQVDIDDQDNWQNVRSI